MTPLGAVVRGKLAGLAGTVAMDLYWYAWYRRGGGERGFLEWDFAGGLRDWEQAPAPAQVGKLLYEGFFQRALPADYAALTTNIMHWGYGTAWGAVYGLVAGSVGVPRAPAGLAFGSLVWASDYVILPLAKLYQRPWEYDATTLARDLGAHLVYGLTTAAVFRELATRPARRRDG
jgi:hypothetical protein